MKAKDTRRKQLQIKLLTSSNYKKPAKGASLDVGLWQPSSNTLCEGSSAEADARIRCHTKTSQKFYLGADTKQVHVKDEETTPLTKRKHPYQPTVHKRGFNVHVLAPTTLLNPGNSDPFNASVLPIDAHTSSLIAVAFEYHAAVVWALEAHLGQDSAALATWWNNLTGSLGHEGLMASFFGYASALKEQLQFTKSLNVPAELGAATLSYKMTAITILRKQLEEDALELSALQIVTRLMRLEAYSFNPQAFEMKMQACKMHMQAAKHIVAGLGGLSALPWSQREFLVAADTNLFFILRDKPVFAVGDWDPGPFLDFTTDLHGETGLVRTIQKEVNNLSHLDHVYGMCDESISAMLTDLREALAVEDILRSEPQNVRNYAAVYRWLHPRFTACRSRLNTYYLDIVVPLVEELRNNDPIIRFSQDLTSRRRKLMSACVCVTAMYCERLVFYQNFEMLNRWNTFSSMQHALILCLGSVSTEYKDDMAASKDFMLRQGPNVLLWAACILMIMPTVGIKRIEVPYETVRDLLGFLTVSLNLKNLEDVTQVCRTLIWHDRVMTPPLARVLQGALPNLGMSHYRIGQGPLAQHTLHLDEKRTQNIQQVSSMAVGTMELPRSLLGYHRQLSPSAAVKVSPICLGAMSFGTAWESYMGQVTKQTTFEILDYFYSQGGNFIDTASNYQNGQSETLLGEWMAERGNRDEMVIATKFTSGYMAHLGDKMIQSNFGGSHTKALKLSVKHSLKKLQTDYIDILYLHWWDYSTSIPEVMHALNDLVMQGQVHYLGVSDTPAWIVSSANAYARAHHLRPFVVYQGLWSAATRDMERDILPMCGAEGLGVTPWGALGGGNFKSKSQREKQAQNPGRKIRPPSEDEQKVTDTLEAVAERKGSACTITGIAMAYVMHKQPYVFPVVGGRTVEQLKGNIDALETELTRQEMVEIEAAVPFKLGFPHDLVGQPTHQSGAITGDAVQLTKKFAHFDFVQPPQPIQNGVHKKQASGVSNE